MTGLFSSSESRRPDDIQNFCAAHTDQGSFVREASRLALP
jgi:hypothetical protein